MEKIENKKVLISNTFISDVNLNETISVFNNYIQNGFKVRVCVIPVNCIVWASENEYLKQIYNSSDVSLCDGVPLLWIAKFLGTPLSGRVTGLDLFPLYVEECYKKGFSFFLLGAKEGVGAYLKQQFEQKYPGIKIVGVYSPPYADRFSDEENQKMINMINAVKPNVLWVSLTAPKQDIWIYEHFEKLDVNIAIGVGGAFEVTAGLIKRSPRWMQKAGLEWFYRFLKEPKRLFNRYFIEAPKIFKLVLKQKYSSHDKKNSQH
ncbi:MAG: WecB/TagA/CpsF family glycosyltransferase [Bacteroidota bacterium]|nr:WecB/TagA/CpsF family glycosyltransferase [Bacteroidota bacterium]